MIKYTAIAAALFVTACASSYEKLESKIEDYNTIVASYCRSGQAPTWFHNGEYRYLFTCATGQTFSIKKD